MHVPLPFASVVRDKSLAAQAHGLSQQDWCSSRKLPAGRRPAPQSRE
jgi:hypothetical protein